MRVYLAVDVGTGSVRAGVFDQHGTKLAFHSNPIKTRHEKEDYYEQSSDDIWKATIASVRRATELAKETVHGDISVAAIGFDATCSLVVCNDDEIFSPISIVSENEGDAETVYNVMLWLDRRAMCEAATINKSTHEDIKKVRSHFGNVMSPENEPPKLLWLQKFKPKVIQQGVFFDLADWMAFKCTGNSQVRSACTVSCKWGWGSNEGDEGEWNVAFWKKLGLGSLCEHDFRKIGSEIIMPGRPIGQLTDSAASDLRLPTDCVVASSMIDAHAGFLWTLGVHSPLTEKVAPSVEQRLSVIAGTSTCYIQLSKEARFAAGVWGPFRDAVLPGFHVTEGGQTVTGKLLENTIKRHPCYESLCNRVGFDRLYETLAELTEAIVREGKEDPATHVHCLDYHAGNRSPRADPSLQGIMTGLSLSDDEFDLAVKFRATLQALCYGARHIVERIQAAGHEVKLVTACGGLCKSRLFLTELADCISVPIVLSSERDTVLLGGAILARVAVINPDAQNLMSCIVKASSAMTTVGEIIYPNLRRRLYHDKKYNVYLKMHTDFMSYRALMNDGSAE